MNICFLLGGLSHNGGIGRVVALLSSHLAKLVNGNIHVLSYYDTQKPMFYKLAPEIKHSYLLKDYQSMTSFLLRGGEKVLRSFLSENSIDVIIACGALFFPVSVRATKGIQTRCVCWEHTAPRQNSDHKAQSLARWYGIHRSDLNVVLTKSALEMYTQKYHAKNTVQIYNPIDELLVNNAKNYNANSKKILSVGRLCYQKNFQCAVSIAKRILPNHPDWRWDIYGQGEDYDELSMMIQENGLSAQMRLCGQVGNLYELYSEYAFMVMTSRYEGFPMSLLEGIGNGLPLISFDVPTGPNEIIEDDYNGYLVGAGDIDEMFYRIQCLMNDVEKRVSMSRNGKKQCNRFSCTEITAQWKRELEHLQMYKERE